MKRVLIPALLALMVFIFSGCPVMLGVDSADENPEPELSSEKQILTFELESPAVQGDIRQLLNSIELEVPFGTDVTGLVPIITHTGVSISPASGVPQDFTYPVEYAVTAEDSSTRSYLVTVTVLPNWAKEITRIWIQGALDVADIDQSELYAEATVLYSTDVTQLAPEITHTGASVSPESGIPQDFTNPVQYTVTAHDGSTAAYTVAVLRAPPATDAWLGSLTISDAVFKDDFRYNNYDYDASVPESAATVTITATPREPHATVVYHPSQNPTLAPGGNEVEVVVTAEDGVHSQTYRVRVDRAGDLISPTLGTLRYVPAGTFLRDIFEDNSSTVSAFRMSEYEVTRAQFLSVTGEDPANQDFSVGMNDPVQRVSWYWAIAFCNLLSIQEGLTPVYSVSGVDFENLAFVPFRERTAWTNASATWEADGYRLATNMEWSWAAMGADTGDPGQINQNGMERPFSGSTGINAIGDYAVFGYSGTEEGRTTTDTTQPVGSRLPNELGIYDMSGNVYEWVWDAQYVGYLAGPVVDYRGPASSASRYVRGGDWRGDSSRCAVEYRALATAYLPYNESLGFRVVRR